MEETKLDVVELQVMAAKAQAFAQGYTQALQDIANRTVGESNGEAKVEAGTKAAE